MTTVLTILHIIFCFTLIAVILLQAGRGQGLAGPAFGGGNVQSLFGTQAADFMTKATTVAAICFLLTSIGLDIIEVRKSKSLLDVGRNSASTLDVDTIKKAIEKIEEEKATTDALDGAGAAASNVESAATEAVEDAKSAANDLAGQAEDLATDATDEANKASDALAV